jgi:hypothetical protein
VRERAGVTAAATLRRARAPHGARIGTTRIEGVRALGRARSPRAARAVARAARVEPARALAGAVCIESTRALLARAWELVRVLACVRGVGLDRGRRCVCCCLGVAMGT